MPMRFWNSLLLAIFFVAIPNYAFANSGPVYWQGYPASESMSVEKNSPIAVESEYLTFDFSKGQLRDYSLAAEVTASYQMVNTKGRSRNETMAFPFVSSIYDAATKNILITAGGKQVPYQLYVSAEPVEEAEFESVVADLSQEIYTSDKLPADAVGTLYRFSVNAGAQQLQENTQVVLTFTLENPNAILLAKGFSSYSWNEGVIQLTFRPAYEKKIEIFSLQQEALQPEIRYDTDQEQTLTEPVCEISSSQIALYDYVLQEVKQAEGYQANISDIQYYNVFAQELEANTAQYNGCIILDDVMSALLHYERVITLVYDVDFEPRESKEVSVSYLATGTMDNREKQKLYYQYEYLLEPAQYWQDFGTLDVEVILPSGGAYGLESNLELTSLEHQEGYKGHFSTLPRENLTFVLQDLAVEQGGATMDYSQVFIFAVAFVLLGGLLFSSIMGYRKSKRAYMESLEARRNQED